MYKLNITLTNSITYRYIKHKTNIVKSTKILWKIEKRLNKCIFNNITIYRDYYTNNIANADKNIMKDIKRD